MVAGIRERLAPAIDDGELFGLGVTLVLAVVVNRAVRSGTLLSVEHLDNGWLLATAVGERTPWWIIALLPWMAAWAFGPGRMVGAWSELDFGRPLRWLCGSQVVILAWTAAFMPYNFFTDQAYWLDRIATLVLAAAVLWRPVFLLPFALQVKALLAQTLVPFGFTAVTNMMNLSALIVVIVAVAHLWFVFTGRRSTSNALLLCSVAAAVHFFVPGQGKIAIGWLIPNDLSNLPLAGYSAGWLGQTSGEFSLALSSFLDLVNPLAKVLILTLELGAAVALLRRNALRLWLVGWIGLHLGILAAIGFLFINWMVLELTLLIILSRSDLSAWYEPNFRPVRSLVAAAAVVLGSILFQPPGLAWFDVPLSHGYRIEAVGVSGQAYNVPMSTFAPLEHNMTFVRWQPISISRAVGGYGAVGTVEELRVIEGIDDRAELEEIELSLAPPGDNMVAESERFMLAFFQRTNQEPDHAWWYRLHAPTNFLNGAPAPTYSFQEPLTELTVELETAIHSDEPTRFRREVLRIERQADGSGRIVGSP